MLPTTATCHLILPIGANLTIWTPRDDKPGRWAAVTLLLIHGHLDARHANERGCALQSPWGLGHALLLPYRDRQPPKTAAMATTAPTAVKLELGQSIAFWYRPDAYVWHMRHMMANANANGIRLTAGQGGRGRLGLLRMSSMGLQEPPEAAYDAVKLHWTPPV